MSETAYKIVESSRRAIVKRATVWHYSPYVLALPHGVYRVLQCYVRLAFNSFARTPALTALMGCAIALGIASCIITLTIERAMSANPIPEKADRLFTVTMDSWDPNHPADSDQPEWLPPLP
jgi:hypothetical protein